MKKIRIADLAEGDLDGIWLYIAAKSGSEDIANGVVDSIVAGFSLLARAPKAGTRRDAVDPDVRGLPIGSYVIYYRETEVYVVIARVLHGSRDQASAYWKT